MALTEEQKEFIDNYLCELNRKGEFHTTSDHDIAAHLLEEHADKLVNENTGNLYHERTIRRHIEAFIDSWLGNERAFRRGIVKKLMYASEELADRAPKDTRAYKVLTEKFVPDNNEHSNKPALSPGAITILQRKGVGTAIVIGPNPGAEGAGHQGHERPDTVHTVASEQQEYSGLEALSPGDDTPVRDVYQGGDIPEGTVIPDTKGSSEDSVDINSGADMGVVE